MPTSGKCTYLPKSATLLCCLSPILVEILPFMQISSDILVSMSVVDNSAPLFFHSSHFNYNDNKSNPLSRVLKENINKIYKMQHFSTLGNAAYKFFKTFRANPAWAECVSRDRGVEYFREDRQHSACDNSEPKLT